MGFLRWLRGFLTGCPGNMDVSVKLKTAKFLLFAFEEKQDVFFDNLLKCI